MKERILPVLALGLGLGLILAALVTFVGPSR